MVRIAIICLLVMLAIFAYGKKSSKCCPIAKKVDKAEKQSSKLLYHGQVQLKPSAKRSAAKTTQKSCESLQEDENECQLGSTRPVKKQLHCAYDRQDPAECPELIEAHFQDFSEPNQEFCDCANCCATCRCNANFPVININTYTQSKTTNNDENNDENNLDENNKELESDDGSGHGPENEKSKDVVEYTKTGSCENGVCA